MFTNVNLAPVADGVELLIAELNQVRFSRLPFRIVHRLRVPGTDCAPGEEVLAILLIYRGHEYQLRLSPALLLLADYLALMERVTPLVSQTGLDTAQHWEALIWQARDETRVDPARNYAEVELTSAYFRV